MKNSDFLAPTSTESEDNWLSVSDLMAGLMIIFLFIAVAYMVNVQNEKKSIQRIAVTYQKLQVNLYEDLKREFKHDLNRWNAAIDRDRLSVRFLVSPEDEDTFREPEVLFKVGSDTIENRFKIILIEFIPRYLKILRKNVYRDEIAEIRIEGHTSSEYKMERNRYKKYIKNMELSQDRAREVLRFILLEIPAIVSDSGIKPWLRQHITANGLSSSQLIITTNGTEDRIASRRVEFRVVTNAEKKIVQIIQEVED